MTWKEKSPREASRGSRRVALLAFLFACPILLLMTIGWAAKSDPVITHAAESNDGYVGSQACSSCHQGIYQQFTKTSMGRSMSLVTPAFLQKASLPSQYFNERLDRLFEVYSQDGNLYQSESVTGIDGKESFRDVHQLEWIIGSGVNGFGGLLRKGGFLFQAPLSYYSHPMTWEPSPGYESIDLGFSRPITPGCIFCHSGRPNPVTGTNGQFDSNPFSQLAIGCESCHGPGAAHIQAMSGEKLQTQAKAALIDVRIVNPAHLTPDLANNICMGCHQNGDARVLKPGKTYQDFRPGSPLDNTLSILMVPPKRESPPTADHLEHYYSMTLSKCYRSSSGRLRCITCHDPHVEPSREEAPAYFAAKCLTCHTNQSCKLPIATRMQQKPANNCIDCHMPKRDSQVISHSSATNHRILARPDEPFPDFAFHQTTESLPDLIHINPGPGQEAVPPPLLTLLGAYGELAQKHPEYVAAYLKVLDRLQQTQPNDPLVQASLGRRDLKNGDYQAAAAHLRGAVENDATTATTYADLADALAHLGQTEEAIPLLEKAIELDPFNPLSRKMLIVDLIQAKQYEKAETALEQYSSIFPQDDVMRKALARARASSPQP
jgi:Tetratricopeptide repeat